MKVLKTALKTSAIVAFGAMQLVHEVRAEAGDVSTGVGGGDGGPRTS
jgi:hypothetical protein